MKITKKIISVLLSLALVLSVSVATVSAIDETTVTYYIGDTAVKTVSEFVTAQHKPLFYAPDLQPDLVPANSYFTGWYLNPDCTGSPISPDGVYFSAEGLKLYAGFKQYESSFTPHYSTEGFEKFDMNRIQVFYPRMMGDTFVPNIQNTKGSKTTTTTDYEGDTVWRLLVSGASPYFFYDENAVAYQVKPGVSYKVSFQYKYEFPATNTTEVFFEVGIGSKISNFTSDGKMTGDANSYKYKERIEKIIPSKLGPTAKTNWETVELVLPALADADLETHYPILGFRTTHCSNEGLIDIKNLKVEEVKPTSVVYHYLDKDGKDTQVTLTDGVVAEESFAIKFVAPGTSDKYFVGWYTDAQFTGEPVASITVVDGVNNLYARYKEYKTEFTPVYNASHGGTNNHYPNAYHPVKRYDTGVYYSNMNIVNYTINGVNKNEDYYSVLTNGQSALYFTDEDNFLYQIKQGATYRVSFEYKHNGGGDKSLNLQAAIGLSKKAVTQENFYKTAAAYKNANPGAQSNIIVVNNTDEWKTAEIVISANGMYLDDYHAVIGLFWTKAGSNDGEGFYFKDLKVEMYEKTAEGEPFVTFENYSSLSQNGVFDTTNKYAIARYKAQYTLWQNNNQNGAWANPTKQEKEYTIYKNQGFMPENFAIVGGGMDSEKALKFKQTANGTKYKVADISNGVLLKDNTTYTATFYYKAEGESNKDLEFGIANAVNCEMLGKVNTVVIPANQVASDWTKVTITFTTDFGYHNADYAISSEMFCIPVLCVNHNIDDTARTVYIDNVSIETSINCGGVSVLTAEKETEIGKQALRVYFNYLPNENGEITIGGESVSVIKRGVLLAPSAKLNNKTDKNGNFIRDMVETPNIFVKENAEEYGFVVSEKAENLTDCWANENGVLTYSTYIKNFKVNDENQIAVRGYIELSDGRIIYSDIYTYSVSDVKAVNALGSEKTYYDFSKTEIAEKLVLQGNTKVLETGVTSDWNSQTVKMKANCVGNVTVKVHKPLGSFVRFKVLVDGVRVTGEFVPNVVDKANNVYEFTFNVGKQAGVREIQIVRLNETTSGPCEIMGAEFIGELLKAEQAETLIEFLGDSISHGGEGSRTYAFLSAQKLGFDFRIRSRSGMGFAQSNDGSKGIGKCWADTYKIDTFIRSETTPYSINRRADVVCIYLGTNDHLANQSKPKAERDALYEQGMKNLISIVKEYNPNAKFVWITGGMTNGYKDAAVSVMNDLGGEANGHYVFSFDGPEESVAEHPTTEAHEGMSELFCQFLTKKGVVK